jgi:hypothetical protein
MTRVLFLFGNHIFEFSHPLEPRRSTFDMIYFRFISVRVYNCVRRIIMSITAADMNP